MIILLGTLIVLGSVWGGFALLGGHISPLVQLAELLIVAGAASGALVIMSPRKVLRDLARQILRAFKIAPYNRRAYEELLKTLFDLFMLGRRNGVIALEEHILNPQSSPIFRKYPTFLQNKPALDFLCNGLRPVIDRKIKPDQLQTLLDIDLERIADEQHAPVAVLSKVADAMPGFGIVAAVLGIVVTMASIAGPPDQIGQKVAAALVGTFLGVFLCYGFINPLAMNLEFTNASELAYTRCIAHAMISFANGMAPIMAVEVGRRTLTTDLKPTADQLETMLKNLHPPPRRDLKPEFASPRPAAPIHA